MPRIIKLPHSHVALIDNEDYDKISSYKWHEDQDGYAQTKINKNGKRTTTTMHRMILNAQCGDIIDHKNHNPLDNRKGNLRFCTDSQNQANAYKPKRHWAGKLTSKFKGVRLSQGKYWRATIFIKGRYHQIGMFKTEIEAALAYNNRAKKEFGKFALVNSIGRT